MNPDNNGIELPDTVLTHEPPTNSEFGANGEQGEEEEELLRAPEGTPIIVNTVSGRQLILHGRYEVRWAEGIHQEDGKVIRAGGGW